jgi:ADP-ribose pyrophosphatase
MTSSNYIYRGKKVSLKIKEFIKPSGRLALREIVEYRTSVAVLPLIDDEIILLLKQFRPVIDKWIYEIPAGTLELNEDPYDCAKRELEEETGYKANKLTKLFKMYLAPGYSTERLHSFLAYNLQSGLLCPDQNEKIKVIKKSLKQTIKMIKINKIVDAKTIATILYYKNFVINK